MFHSSLPTAPSGDTAATSPRSIELGLRAHTLTPSAGGIEVRLATNDDGREDISRIRIHATHLLDDADRVCFARPGIAAPASLPLTVTLPRSLWRALPCGQEALRMRYRARVERDGDGLRVMAVAVSLFPARA